MRKTKESNSPKAATLPIGNCGAKRDSQGRSPVFNKSLPAALVLCAFSLSACTGQIPGSFRYIQQTESFNNEQSVNTKIDLLWVVDNSSSMDVSQQKLRAGFQSFANKYMKPTWDIRVAVITTDTYIANPAYATYLSTVVPGSVGYISTYISGRLGTFVNPSWDTSLINLATGAMGHGVRYNDLAPLWGSSYAQLLAGFHDGPITSFCFEGMPYFFSGVTQCSIRDVHGVNVGTSHCLNPGVGESSLSQCVNTVQNDTVRSGKPIISTMPPSGTPGNSAWVDQLVKDFMVNVSAGSSGLGSERGISSVLQMLTDNEGTASAFFRQNSLRGIIFVSDEDDQSIVIPSSPPVGFKPFTGYGCDQASLITLNGASAVTGNNGICCSDPAKNCSFGSAALSCAPKTVDGYTYTLGICVDPTQLLPIATAKQTLDQFFLDLDGASATTPNYFITAITPTSAAGIQSLQTARYSSDTTVGTHKVTEVNRGDRYIALGQLVSSDSLALDISSSDYSPILDAIGQQIIAKKSTFTVTRAPTGQEDMVVSIQHVDGSVTAVPNTYFYVSGDKIIFTNQDFVLSLQSTDTIIINYQPKAPKGA